MQRRAVYRLRSWDPEGTGWICHGGRRCDIEQSVASVCMPDGEGMQTLRLNGAHKVIAGDTTIAEVMRVAPPLQLS